jgi:hypothetical protein
MVPQKYPQRFNTKVSVTTNDGTLVTDDEFVRRRLKRSMVNILAISHRTLGMLGGVLSCMRTEKFKLERESRKRARA